MHTSGQWRTQTISISAGEPAWIIDFTYRLPLALLRPLSRCRFHVSVKPYTDSVSSSFRGNDSIMDTPIIKLAIN